MPWDTLQVELSQQSNCHAVNHIYFKHLYLLCFRGDPTQERARTITMIILMNTVTILMKINNNYNVDNEPLRPATKEPCNPNSKYCRQFYFGLKNNTLYMYHLFIFNDIGTSANKKVLQNVTLISVPRQRRRRCFHL